MSLSTTAVRDPADRQDIPAVVVPTETVAMWPAGMVPRGLAPVPEGRWLVTLPGAGRVDLVEPDGSRTILAELPGMPMGAVVDDGGAFVVAGTPGDADWRLYRVYLPSGADPVADLPELRRAAALVRAGGRFLMPDPVRGIVLAFDPETGTSKSLPWPGPLSGAGAAIGHPGEDGVAVHADGRVFVTGGRVGGVLERGPGGVRRLLPDTPGRVTGRAQNVLWDRRDPGAVHVTLSSVRPFAGPSRLVRIAV